MKGNKTSGVFNVTIQKYFHDIGFSSFQSVFTYINIVICIDFIKDL